MTSPPHRRTIFTLAGPLSTVGIIVVLYLPTWRWLITRWWYDPNYSHAFLVLPIALALIWLQRQELRAVPPRPGRAGLVALCLAVAGHLAAIYAQQPLLSALTLPVSLAGLLWFLHGLPLLKKLWFPVVFLWLMVPLPWGEGFDARLQAAAARLSAAILAWLGVQVAVLGAEISLAGTTFTVGAACSGLRSSMALLTVGAVLAYVMIGPRWARYLLVLAIVPIALASNLLRLVSLLLVAQWFGTRAALAYYHGAAGLLLFLCAVLLFLGLARVLGCRPLVSRWERD